MKPCSGSISDFGLRIADSKRTANPQSAIRNPQCSRRAGFSLGEMLAVVIIGSMILVAVLTVYSRANQAADAVLRRVDSPAWGSEVLQLIAKDLDRIMSAEDVTVQIRNGLDNKFQRAELVLRRTYHDAEGNEQTLEAITWRAGYDHEGRTPGLMLYRSYEGLAPEDKLLDDNREDVEKSYPFVPVCRGLTFFRIQACKGTDLIGQWPPSAPPAGIKITLSFAEAHETISGGFDVADAEKISRTVAINPMRPIRFALSRQADANGAADPNAPAGAANPDQSSGRQSPAGQSSRGRAVNERTTNARTSTPTRSR